MLRGAAARTHLALHPGGEPRPSAFSQPLSVQKSPIRVAPLEDVIKYSLGWRKTERERERKREGENVHGLHRLYPRAEQRLTPGFQSLVH